MDCAEQTHNFYLFLGSCISIFINWIIDAIRNFDYQQAGLRLLTFYSETVETCKREALVIYAIPCVKNVVDEGVYLLQSIKCSAIGQRIEPYETNWISSTVLRKETSLAKNNMEVYERFNGSRSSWESFYYACSTLTSVVECDSKMEKGLVTMKIGDSYFVRSHLDDSFDGILESKPFTNRFLSIEYTHPEMTKPIVIDLDKGYWLTENHILSNVFVKRWLEYQSLAYKFDKRYSIKILDGDINVKTMSWEQEIILKKDNIYEIIG
jgi:hypothetical protein